MYLCGADIKFHPAILWFYHTAEILDWALANGTVNGRNMYCRISLCSQNICHMSLCHAGTMVMVRTTGIYYIDRSTGMDSNIGTDSNMGIAVAVEDIVGRWGIGDTELCRPADL
jgi:hypothetical protein